MVAASSFRVFLFFHFPTVGLFLNESCRWWWRLSWGCHRVRGWSPAWMTQSYKMHTRTCAHAFENTCTHAHAFENIHMAVQKSLFVPRFVVLFFCYGQTSTKWFECFQNAIKTCKNSTLFGRKQVKRSVKPSKNNFKKKSSDFAVYFKCIRTQRRI